MPPWTAFIHGRVALADASELIERYGDDAGFEAASAPSSRDDGNVARFCHWRQIERVIATLAATRFRAPSTKLLDARTDVLARFRSAG